MNFDMILAFFIYKRENLIEFQIHKVSVWTMHLCTVYESNKLHFLEIFSLKIDLTVLFTHLKIILLQYF